MSKKHIKFRVLDKDTLELAEDSNKGDIIKLSESENIQVDVECLTEKLNKAINDKIESETSKINSEWSKTLNEKTFELKKINRLEVEKEYSERLNNSLLKTNALESQLNVIKFDNENKLKIRELEIQKEWQQKIEKLRQDFEAQRHVWLSTNIKLYGEDLEKRIWEIWLDHEDSYAGASFIKDNQAGYGETKGDFIYRELSDAGEELLSVMIECKSETLNSVNKKKNEYHYEKLEKDRVRKNCKFSILVTELEPSTYISVLTNKNYPYMYVVRPDGFWAIIKTLHTMVKNSTELLSQIQQLKSNQTDILNCEVELKKFADSVQSSIDKTKSQHEKSIEFIDKAIEILTKVKESLLVADKHIDALDNKVYDVSLRKIFKSKNYNKLIETLNENDSES